ncbi:hypothetical protein JR316_0006188 [Psilocybe cubensis]|uniref:Uncharacterized protein n=2 Tax=Psilocybe cubensis TaxID=181762 RepID=A0A8H7Y3I5_PSICU|nr:hypothetical protein JR316_0006188 [Psilocybe cubensis]KAH9481661.1 hypothetical protein JR316_0006188 [Psilocybe cubensis]
MNPRVPKQPPTWAMDTLEQRKWYDCEVNLILVAEKVRLWCRIPGTPPPVPQSLGYMLKHRTEEAAYRSINASRNAFILWMGYLSYLCAQSRREVHSRHIKHDPRSPVPAWHHRLRSEHPEITEAWLDGFYNSNVYSYDAKTPRAGIVYDWTSTHPTRPPVDWFLEHSIPVYYPWRIQEEEFIVTHLNVNPHLQPPHDLLAQLLTELFESMDVSFAAAFARKFFSHVHPTEGLTMKVLGDKYSRTLVYSILSNHFAHDPKALDRYMSRPFEEMEAALQQKDEEQRKLAIDSANLPTLHMIELPHGNLRLLSSVHDDWDAYWAARVRERQKILATETEEERIIRLNRETDPPINQTKVFVWKTLVSTEGSSVYLRQHIAKSAHEREETALGAHQKVYNGVKNEWDFCKHLLPPSELAGAFVQKGHHEPHRGRYETRQPGRGRLSRPAKIIRRDPSPQPAPYDREDTPWYDTIEPDPTPMTVGTTTDSGGLTSITVDTMLVMPLSSSVSCSGPSSLHGPPVATSTHMSPITPDESKGSCKRGRPTTPPPTSLGRRRRSLDTTLPESSTRSRPRQRRVRQSPSPRREMDYGKDCEMASPAEFVQGRSADTALSMDAPVSGQHYNQYDKATNKD